MFAKRSSNIVNEIRCEKHGLPFRHILGQGGNADTVLIIVKIQLFISINFSFLLNCFDFCLGINQLPQTYLYAYLKRQQARKVPEPFQLHHQ